MKHFRLLMVAGLAFGLSACSNMSLCRVVEEEVVVAAPAPAPAPDPCTDLVRLYGVNFDFDKSDIRVDAEPVLNEVISSLGRCPAQRVEVSAHTDSVGSDAYNQGLSERRAQSVVNYLVGGGLNADVLDAQGFGESKPIASNDTDEGRAQNRRVELKPID